MILKADSTIQGKAQLSLQRNICKVKYVYAWCIMLCYVKISLWVSNNQSHYFIKQRNVLPVFGKMVHGCQWTKSQTGGSWLGTWGACCGELQQTRGAYNPSFPSRKSLLLQPLISAAFYPNCFFLSDLLWRIILTAICESNVGVESTQQPRFLDPQHPLMAKHGNFLFSMILVSVSVKHCQASTGPRSAHSIMDH